MTKNIKAHLILLLVLTFSSGCSNGIFGNKKNIDNNNTKNTYTTIKIVFNSNDQSRNFALRKELYSLRSSLEKESNNYSGINKELYWQAEGKSLLKKTLASLGYYTNSVRSTIIYPKNRQTKRQKIIISFDITLNKLFRFNQIKISHSKGSNKNISLPTPAILNIKKGTPATASKAFDASRRIEEYIEENNCLLNIDIKHQAQLDLPKNSLDINFIVTANDKALIRQVHFSGKKKVKEDYLRQLVTIKPDTCYRPSTISASVSEMQKTGLFNSVTPNHPSKPDNDGKIDLTYKLIERKNKTFKGGASYGTDLGFGLTSGWSNRNLFGRGEKLSTNMFINEKEQFFDLVFSKPMFKRTDQDLKLGLELENERKKAYSGKALKISGGIERRFNKKITAGVGGQYIYTKIKETNSTKDFSLFGVPFFITSDTRGNKLNPHKGVYTKLEMIPFLNYNEVNNSFLKSKMVAATYFNIGTGRVAERYDPVLAFRGTVGSILGPETKKIPANERFYLGGVNSVRGYKPQSVGRLSNINIPLGGDILAEGTAELRLKLTDNLGLVTFYDIGTNDSIELQDLDQQFLSSVGFGIRLFNDFVPLRFDFALPTKKIESSDGLFQVYLGIGHSF